jgi:phosphatidylinositol alpha-1,6-mannosyltransferase
MQARWADEARLLTLLNAGAPGSLDASTAARVRFAARVTAGQSLGRCEWTFYSHLSLAKVQRVVPWGRRRPYFLFLHGIEAWCPLSAAGRALLAGAALRVANSAYTARRVLEAQPNIGEVSVCPLAVPPRWTKGQGRTGEMTGVIGPRAAVIVARLSATERYKGHDALLEAWPAVIARLPDAQLVVVGGGDDLGRLQRKAGELNVSERVLFTGFVSEDDLAALYARAAILAMPSRGEGFGLAYLEAMAQGLPCIGSVHDAASEVIEDGVTGFLVDQADTPALADRLVCLLSDEGRRRAMGAAGRRRVQDRFTPEQFAARLGDLIDGTRPAGASVAARHAVGSH